MKAVYLEDNFGDYRLVYEALKKYNVELIHAQTITRLGAILLKNTIDCVLFDLNLLASEPEETLATVKKMCHKEKLICVTGATFKQKDNIPIVNKNNLDALFNAMQLG